MVSGQGHTGSAGGGSGNEDEAKRKLAEEQRRRVQLGDDIDQEGVIVWKYPFKGKMLRIETPEDITSDLWNKLKRYIEVLQPDK